MRLWKTTAAVAVAAAAMAAAGAPASGAVVQGKTAVPAEALQVASKAYDDGRRHERSLQGAAARKERRATRDRYHGKLGRGGLKLAHETFGTAVTGPMWSQPDLGEGVRKSEMLSDNVARLEKDGKPGGLLDSLVPLQSDEGDGTNRPTDLSLVPALAGFRAANPIVPALLPSRLADGVRLADTGVTVVPETARAADGVLSEDRVFYADADTDTDVFIGAGTGGAAIHYQLRSAQSPERLTLRVDMPAGSSLRSVTGKLGGVDVVNAGGDVIATVRPPLVTDAEGETIPSRYDIDGDRVRLVVQHADRDVAYPLLVDPVVDAQHWAYNNGGNVNGWFYETAHPAFFSGTLSGSWGAGLYSVMGGGRTYGSGTSGQWKYPLSNSQFVYRTVFETERQQTNSPYQAVCMTVALANNASGWDAGTYWTKTAAVSSETGRGPYHRCNTFSNQNFGNRSDQCLRSDCAAPATHEPNYPIFQQWAYGDGQRDGWNVSYIGGAEVYLSDNEAPSIGSGPTVFDHPGQTYGLYFADPGLGVKQVSVSLLYENGFTWNQEGVKKVYDCTGTVASKCPQDLQGITLTYGNLRVGSHTIRVTVTDAGGKVGTKDFVVTRRPVLGLGADISADAYYSGRLVRPFQDPLFQRLNTKRYRITAPFDAIDNYPSSGGTSLNRLDNLINEGVAAGQEIMVTIAHSDAAPNLVPGPSLYRDKVAQLVQRYPQVTFWGVANEPNNGYTWLGGDQDTPLGSSSRYTTSEAANWSKAHILASWYQQLVALVGPYKLVGPDFHDGSANLTPWVAAYRAQGGGFGVAASLHPYGDFEGNTISQTLAYKAALPPGTSIIVTEVGAETHRVSVTQQSTLLSNYLSRMYNEVPEAISLYYYHLYVNPGPAAADKWDSGLLDPYGNRRESWFTFCSYVPGADCSR